METASLHVGFVSLSREFGPGDAVELEIPLPLRLVPTPDDPTLASLELGPTVLLARDEATTTRLVAPAAHRRLDGSLSDFERDRDLVRALGHTFEPAWSGGDHRYHLYVRIEDDRIAFRGSDSGVPDRKDQDGWSFLTGLWSGGGFATVRDFLSAVHHNALQAAKSGLLSRSETTDVLNSAAAGTLDDPSHPRRGTTDWDLPANRTWSERPEDSGPGFQVFRSSEPVEDVVVWELPEDVGAGHAAPVIRVDVQGERAPSGWYTSLRRARSVWSHLARASRRSRSPPARSGSRPRNR